MLFLGTRAFVVWLLPMALAVAWTAWRQGFIPLLTSPDTWRVEDMRIEGNVIVTAGASGILVDPDAPAEIHITNAAFHCYVPGCPEPRTWHIHESQEAALPRRGPDTPVLPDPPNWH